VAALIADPRSLLLLLTRRPGYEHDEIVGCCHLRDDGGRAYFGLFAVRPGLQGGGIGQAIMAEAQRQVVERWGAQEMWMTVISQRHDLIAWYERLGFVLTGETQPFPYGHERFGLPKRADLEFAVLAKSLGCAAPPRG
jgi:ribosomal protein S18 acetylase RimI-like enzyme